MGSSDHRPGAPDAPPPPGGDVDGHGAFEWERAPVTWRGEVPSPTSVQGPASLGYGPESSLFGAGPGGTPPGPGRARRAAPARSFTARLGLLGASALGLACLVLDALTAISLWSLPLTLLQVGLLWPWAKVLLRRRPYEAPRSSGQRLRQALLAWIVVAVAVAAAFGKAFVLARALQLGDEAFVSAYRSYGLVLLVVATFGLLGRGDRAARFLHLASEDPARLMVVSFGATALVGAFLLSLPQAVTDIREVSFLDALFTATSAVCVTGLVVNDISHTYSTFGQVVILILVQVGGLGIMVLSSAFAILAGQRLRTKQSAVMMGMVDAGSLVAVRRTLLSIVGYTFLFELLGGVALYGIARAWHPEVGLGPADPNPLAGAGDVAWWAVFHAVSAFCNAGLSLSHGNLAGFVRWAPVQLVVMALILLGGLGFPVIDELFGHAWARLRWRRPRRLSLHARVVLLSTAALVIGPAVILPLLEAGGAFSGVSWSALPVNALFQSVTLRTAGFNTVDFGAMGPAALLVACLVMFVGASPGSTGGGIKTTTAAALVAMVRDELRSGGTRLLDRRLPASTASRAVSVTVLSVLLVLGFSFALLLTEAHPPLQCVFEVVSAFATCGLSTGITAALSPAGKLVIIAAMLTGRVGPLTLALATAAAPRTAQVALPEERLMIG